MKEFRIFLFRRLILKTPSGNTIDLEGQKIKELLCYLLIHRHRPHTRDTLASLLWKKSSDSQAKRYLRQSLWQLHSVLDKEQASDQPLISVDGDWVQFNRQQNVWLDVDAFERAFADVKGVEGRELDATAAANLRQAVELYRGDLLENWYQEWCLFERERLQNTYLAMLDKLVGYCESTNDFDAGRDYGGLILCCEKAHERTFRRLMRLNYFARDRTGALRLYQRCKKVLHDELGVKPSRRTIELFQQIQADQLATDNMTKDEQKSTGTAVTNGQTDHLGRLLKIKQTLVHAQRQIDDEIVSVGVSSTYRL